MFVKKVGSRVYGAEFTAAERKAMDIEIRRQIAEYDRKHEKEMTALILWQLHDLEGFGPKKLKRKKENFTGQMNYRLKRKRV